MRISSWHTVFLLQERGLTIHKTMMPLLSSMVVSLLDFLSVVPVELGFQSSTYLLDFPLCNTIKSVASWLTEMWHEVWIEANLQPISSEQFHQTSLNTEEGVCLDISMNSFWGGQCEKTYIDVKVFNPCAPNNNSSNPPVIYRRHENMMNCSYEDRICEAEHSSFIPLLFSAAGGMAHESSTFTIVLPPSYLKSGPTNILLFWAGFVVAFLFHYYIQPSDVFGPLHRLKLTLWKWSQSFLVLHDSFYCVLIIDFFIIRLLY